MLCYVARLLSSLADATLVVRAPPSSSLSPTIIRMLIVAGKTSPSGIFRLSSRGLFLSSFPNIQSSMLSLSRGDRGQERRGSAGGRDVCPFFESESAGPEASNHMAGYRPRF